MFTRAELEAAGLTDFRVFLVQVWAFLSLPDPTPVQLDIAKVLQHGERRLIVQAFRGVGKSWITVAFVLWTLLLDPQKKILVVSASQNLADDFSKFCKQLIHGMPLLFHLAPRADQISSAIRFDVGPASASKDPSVKSAGITGQITGSRADLIIADDIEIPKNSYSHLLRERLAEAVKEFDAILKPGGRVVYLGTPQIEQSLYGRLEKRGYKTLIWPAEVPDKMENYAGRLAPFVHRRIAAGARPGDPLDEKRFSREDLLERRISYGASGYALQFMLDTNPADADRHPLKLKDLIVADVDDELGHVRLVWGQSRDLVIESLEAGGFDGDCYHRPAWESAEMVAFEGTVMAIDPSGKGNDETAYAVVRHLKGQLYLVASGGFRSGFSEQTLDALAAIAAHHRVNYVVVEENYGGGMFNALLKPHLQRHGRGSIDEDWKGKWSANQKEMRILDTLEPLIQAHRLVVDRRVIESDLETQRDDEKYSLIQQMTRMARVKGCLANEDRLEAVAMACSYWQERLARDQEKAHQSHKEELLKKELAVFLEHAVGRKPRSRKWART